MAALSFCSNWGSSTFQNLNPEMMISSSLSQSQPELLASHFFGLDYNLSLPDTCIDPLFDTNNNDSFCSDNNYTHLNFLSNFHSQPDNSFLSHQTENFPLHDELFESSCYYFPKRQKMSYESHLHMNNNNTSTTSPSFFDGFVPNPGLVSELLPEVVFGQVHDESPILQPSCHGYGSSGNNKEMNSTGTTMKKTSSGGLSAQSIAARERRRKITEKTQELGKLIPGGNKMNTAEMFQSASKYVKFLQSQVSILQFMGSIQETKEEALHVQGLEILASQTIQEKLYTEEKCLVPMEFVRLLANDPEIRSGPFIKEIDQLIMPTNGC
ncbi:hypothetical protein FEM48_Zijuj01G0108400 [Ziziphus jujuba var. spinosa]|uniref:BHLH domain-containing protein n=1 Tax=Ziziphus jujuba var. spinosa TaxID=714518 RepID=A0A978W0U5_ZIZJJ|nr:hypothetical protein FEM48_Zijuj01G0108400 [Ziziphus jujuba var. spinosa]